MLRWEGCGGGSACLFAPAVAAAGSDVAALHVAVLARLGRPPLGSRTIVVPSVGETWQPCSTSQRPAASRPVAPGQCLVGGNRIGAVGSTGRSSGPHPHVELRLRGAALDPLTVL